MTRRSTSLQAVLTVAWLAVATLAVAATPDLYDEAVANTARPAKDVERDKLDHPADILRMSGIKPGMKVVDFLAADGYYTELLSYVVGPKGQVIMLNNKAFDGWSDGAWQKRIADKRLPNVEHRTVDLNDMNLGVGTVDAVLMIKVYHDLYWVDPKGAWPKINVPSVLDQITKALKPGGLVVLVDHSAKAGTGSADASALHRIEESFAQKDFQSRGFVLVGHTDVLRRPDDKRDQISYEGPALGKTDRFALVFQKK